MRIEHKMMTRSALAFAVSASLGTGVALAQQQQQSGQQRFTGTVNETQAQQLFQHMDRDGNGQLSLQETGLFIDQNRFQNADEDNSNSLSPEEFVAAALNDKEMVVQIFARAQAEVDKQRQAQAQAQTQQQSTQTTVTRSETETTVDEEDAMRIGVREASPEINVEQAEPQVTVREQQPEITVEQPKPEVIVKQPAPEVTVNQPEPQVVIEEAQPDVDVDTAEPEVTVRESGQPEVDVETGQAEVTVEQVGQTEEQQTAMAVQEEDTTTVMVEETEVETEITGLYALTIVDLMDREVINANGEEIGDIEELVLNAAGNEIFAIISVGGWLGIGDHDIAISLNELEMVGDQVMMSTQMSEEQLEERPAYNPNQYRILAESNRPLGELTTVQ